MAALSDDAIRAIVGTAGFSDTRATEYLTETILVRKSKVLKVWLNGTNPVVRPALSSAGALSFANAAEEAGVAKAAERYTIQWSRFDNTAGTQEPEGTEQTVTGTRAQAPDALISGRTEYIAAQIRAFHAEHPNWSQPLMVYFRRTGDGWSLVGLERNP
ncbi:MAG: hypothetical protein LC804_22440 [Acidobacteria bacterium]|nr:hypothetical protein [Acidobacteriota bacterium]